MKRVKKGVHTMPVSVAFPVTLDRSETFARDVQATKADLGRFAYLLVGSSAGADDLLAEAYARAWPHYKRGEIDNLGAYLRRSIANLSNGRLRRIRLERRETETRRVDWRAPRMASPESGFEQQVDTQDLLWRAIWSLPPNQRAVVVLRHAEDRSEEETAEILGISLGTVKSRLARGLVTLREKLEYQERREARS
jgi:RNA polymerase sigma-70 factor (sigma-E family)